MKNEKLVAEHARKMTNKACPVICGTDVLEKMRIENLLTGLEDHLANAHALIERTEEMRYYDEIGLQVQERNIRFRNLQH